MSKKEVIVTSMVASRDKSPVVTMAIPHKDCAVQFTCDEARDLARSLIESAHNAETDSAIYDYLIRRDVPMKQVGQTLALIRAARKEIGLE